MNKLGTQPLYW